jgi:hypothetical protein
MVADNVDAHDVINDRRREVLFRQRTCGIPLLALVLRVAFCETCAEFLEHLVAVPDCEQPIAQSGVVDMCLHDPDGVGEVVVPRRPVEWTKTGIALVVADRPVVTRVVAQDGDHLRLDELHDERVIFETSTSFEETDAVVDDLHIFTDRSASLTKIVSNCSAGMVWARNDVSSGSMCRPGL